MAKTIRSLFLALLLAAISVLPGCKKSPPTEITPQTFTTIYASRTGARDAEALASYAGNRYTFNAKVAGVTHEYVIVCCSDDADIHIVLPESELEQIERDDIATFEGTVKEVKTETWNDTFDAVMVIEDARLLEKTFEVTGVVEDVLWDCERDDQRYAAIWDSSIIIDRQISIYLPDPYMFEEGDRITARGKLVYPSSPEEFQVGYIRGRGFPEVFAMPYPEYVRKVSAE